MYIPKQFDEPNVEVMHELMRSHSLATLVTLSDGGLNANHIPLSVCVESGPYGTLRGHVARANPLWMDAVPDQEVLAIFHGPDAYITPNWYPTKQETGKAVPTWNYTAVHAYGRLRVIDDAAWLRTQLEALTAQHESAFAEQWRMADAPSGYIEKLLGAIVGIEIAITRLSGKWKVSQNQPAENQAGVIQGLSKSAAPNACLMAALVEQGAVKQS